MKTVSHKNMIKASSIHQNKKSNNRMKTIEKNFISTSSAMVQVPS